MRLSHGFLDFVIELGVVCGAIGVKLWAKTEISVLEFQWLVEIGVLQLGILESHCWC